MTPWLQYLVAFVVACHGLTYLLFGVFVPRGSEGWRVEGWKGSSWLLGGAVAGEGLKALASALHVAAGVATLGCALAIALAPPLAGWWPPLAVAGGLLGLAGFAVFWDGQVRLLAQEGAVGALIGLGLLLAALAFPGVFG